MKNTVLILLLSFVFMSGSLFGQMSKSKHKKTLELERKEKNEWLAKPAVSPLTESQQENFDGLSFYKIDFDYLIAADFAKAEGEETSALQLSNGETKNLVKYGKVSFEMDGNIYQLDVFYNNGLPEFSDNSNTLFVVFKDKTNAEETFSGGRYLPVKINERGESYIDFNRAMNPFGAYNAEYPYIVPPDGNILPLAMTVGERRHEDR
jgi:uncharacterized protein (DUF1684 family)